MIIPKSIQEMSWERIRKYKIFKCDEKIYVRNTQIILNNYYETLECNGEIVKIRILIKDYDKFINDFSRKIDKYFYENSRHAIRGIKNNV